MANERKKKKEPWRLALFFLAAAFIVYTWAKKDIASIYASAPKEQIVPMIVTAVAVSLLKVAFLAAAVLFIKWLIGRLQKKK